MKKLSDFHGQEHITAPLRASIMKNEELPGLAFLGDLALAQEIAYAYVAALNCLSPNRGDACGVCGPCSLHYLIKGVPVALGNTPPEYIVFETKTASGSFVDKKVLIHTIFAFQGSKHLAIVQASDIAKEHDFTYFVEQYLEIFKNILYLKHNLEIKEVEQLETLRQLAVRLSVPQVTACMRLLWDAQNKTVLGDAIGVEILAALLSEALKPTEEITRGADETPEGPISQVDKPIEQPLDLERMLELARQ